jgi:SAM-dependent methyltransferase
MLQDTFYLCQTERHVFFVEMLQHATGKHAGGTFGSERQHSGVSQDEWWYTAEDKLAAQLLRTQKRPWTGVHADHPVAGLAPRYRPAAPIAADIQDRITEKSAGKFSNGIWRIQARAQKKVVACPNDRRLYLKFRIPEGARVLELGCGTGHLLAALRVSVGVGVDFSQAMIGQARIGAS